MTRLINILIVALLAIGIVVVGFFAPPAGAAELEPIGPPTHQLTICKPGEDCKPHGRPCSGTACDLNAASERLAGNLPKGTRIECRRMRQ